MAKRIAMKTQVKNIVKTTLSLALIFYLNSAFSQSGNCLTFDGSNDRVVVSDANSIDLSSKGTIELWIYINNYSDWAGLVHKGERSDFNDETYSLQFYGGSGSYSNKNLAFAVTDVYGYSYFQASSTVIEKNKWYHVALTWNTASNKRWLRLYINGNLDKEMTLYYPVSTSNGDLFIGSQYNNGYPFDGKIDNVRIWNRSFSTSIIRKLMYDQYDLTSSNLKLYMKLDESSGSTANDETANNNDGTLTSMSSSAWTTSDCPYAHHFLGTSSSNWNSNSNWFGGWKVNSNVPAYIPADATNMPVINNDVSCKGLTVETNASLTISTGKSLTLSGDLTVNGQLVIESGTNSIGSLIDNGTIGGTGTMTMKRYISKNGWHYISSPVSNCQSNTLTNSALYSYNETTSSWSPIGLNQTLTNMAGYDVYYQSNTTASFSGTFNTGTFSNTNLTSSVDGWNFVGNPYPSYIDWDASSGWTKTNIENAIYMWDEAKNTYVSYVDGVGSHSDVDNLIAPTQGFWVKTQAGKTGTLKMNNNVRTHATSSFRSNSNEKNIIHLQVSGEKYTDQTSIAFKTGSDDYFDPTNDARKLFAEGSNGPQLFTSTIDNYQLSINSLPDFYEKEIIPLGVTIGISGTYEISISDSSEFDKNIAIYLEDHFTGEIVNLWQSSYTFDAVNTDDPNRFTIHFVKPVSINTTTSIEGEQNQEIKIYSTGKYVTCENIPSNAIINVYDVMGKQVFASTTQNATTFYQVNLNAQTSGTYIVKITSENESKTEKVAIR